MPDRSSARRAAARLLHPDLGGDGDQFAAALAQIDRRFGGSGATHRGSIVEFRSTRGGSTDRRIRRLRRRARRIRIRVTHCRRRTSATQPFRRVS
ncbi:hypothetical protein EWR22_11375 [Mycolicibacterium monacense DSM 44395]|nr:hypothetical protein EWR22_11375 [Mycolicibacterium monacense DSM 44395]